jgi:hypothetical protein
MNKPKLINEISRIKQIMLNSKLDGNVIVENLLLESPTLPSSLTKALEKLKKYKNDTNLQSLLNRLERSGTSFEEKLVNYINRNFNSSSGKALIRDMFKEASELNYDFADEFTNTYYNDFKKMLKNYDYDRVLRILQRNYGDRVSMMFDTKYRAGLKYWLSNVTKSVVNYMKTKVKNLVSTLFPDYLKIKDRIEENYKKLLTETDGAKIVGLEKTIKKDFDLLNQSARKLVLEIEKTIDAKIRTGSRSERKDYEKIRQILQKIKDEKGEWGVIKSITELNPEFMIFRDALKSAFSLEKNVSNLIGKLNIFKRVKNFAKYFAGELRNTNTTGSIDNSINNVKETPWYLKLVKFLFYATPRGIPRINGLVYLDKPTAYDEILKIAGKFGAYRSLAYELIIRGVKFQFYFAILETLMFYFKINKYDKYIEDPCCNEVSKDMVKNSINTIDEYITYMEKNYDSLPPCLKSLINKKDDDSVAGILTWGYYRSKPQERKKYLGVLVDNLKNIELVKIFSRLVPIATLYEFYDRVSYAGEVYLATGSKSEYENQLQTIRSEREKVEEELNNIDGDGQNPQPSPVEQNFTDDENGLIEYLKTINKEYNPNSYLKAEGEAPSEGQDTEYNMYYFENNKWSLAN